jgi:hypothetical protein
MKMKVDFHHERYLNFCPWCENKLFLYVDDITQITGRLYCINNKCQLNHCHRYEININKNEELISFTTFINDNCNLYRLRIEKDKIKIFLHVNYHHEKLFEMDFEESYLNLKDPIKSCTNILNKFLTLKEFQ